MTHSNGNATRLRFNAQTYLSEMEDRLSSNQREMEARLGQRIDEMKNYCPNSSKVAKFDVFIKWFWLLVAPTMAATIAAIVTHILRSAN